MCIEKTVKQGFKQPGVGMGMAPMGMQQMPSMGMAPMGMQQMSPMGMTPIGMQQTGIQQMGMVPMGAQQMYMGGQPMTQK